jgi:glycosyltransferase involved in cell wall biosynthesis
MRIAQVAPIAEPVPPRLYGGVERVVSYLTEELVALGHDVTLFASGDSKTKANLHVVRPRALRLDDPFGQYIAYHVLALERVLQQLSDFDIVHFHTEPLQFPYARRSGCPFVTTMHGRLDGRHNGQLFKEFMEVPLISISDAQRHYINGANWLGTVYHGLPRDLYKLSTQTNGYVAFLGRIAVEKRPDWAIEVARRSGVPLRIAAKIDVTDKLYFEHCIAPLIDGDLVSYVGEIPDIEKQSFLGNARALLCLGEWPEPFGIVSIEAFACGTPVIATRHGALPEVVDHGVTGFLVNSVDEAVKVLKHVDQLDRPAIRETFQRRFTADRMAKDYLRLFEMALSLSPSLRV